jgi:hypothetical protein
VHSDGAGLSLHVVVRAYDEKNLSLASVRAVGKLGVKLPTTHRPLTHLIFLIRPDYDRAVGGTTYSLFIYYTCKNLSLASVRAVGKLGVKLPTTHRPLIHLIFLIRPDYDRAVGGTTYSLFIYYTCPTLKSPLRRAPQAR